MQANDIDVPDYHPCDARGRTAGVGQTDGTEAVTGHKRRSMT